MKKRLLLLPSALFISLTMASTAISGPIFIGPEVEQIISYDENGNEIITLIFDPAKTPDFMKEPEPERIFEPIPPLTEAPEVEATLGHILKEGENLDVRTADSYTEPYATNSIGQCVWYADGRFMEVHGIRMPFGIGNAKEWIENSYQSNEIKAVVNIEDVTEQSVAVFAPTNRNDTHPGHVVFIEYVERDENYKPLNIYYSEGNSEGKGVFNPSIDGTVKKKSFEDFKKEGQLKLVGYLVPNEK